MFLVREKCFEGEGAVVGSDAQIPASEGEAGAKKCEVRRVAPQGAARAILRLRRIGVPEPCHVSGHVLPVPASSAPT